MIGRVLRFIRLPLVMLLIFAIGRFWLGAAGKVPYAPRGSSMFSIIVLTFITWVYFGALSGRVARLSWGGTILAGIFIALWAQILIFVATYLSYSMGIETSYFRHWDALNVKEGTVVPMAAALKTRAGAFIVFPIIGTIVSCLGRLIFGPLAPVASEN